MINLILGIKGNWKEVVDDCRSTVNKPALNKEPSESFKKAILIAEHSPIRDIRIRWKWDNIKSWVATHWSRHKWECFIQTQRSDRTGVQRDKLPQDSLVSFTGEANVQNLIDTMRKRLCHQASRETREYAEDLKSELKNVEPEISNILVPNCIYRCGCPELNACKFWPEFLKWGKDNNMDIQKMSIQDRYNAYNKYFYDVVKINSI